MTWLIYAIIGAIGVGLYNFYMAATKNLFPLGTLNNIIFMLGVQAFGGIIGVIGLIYCKMYNPKIFNTFFTEYVKFPYQYLFIPTVIQLVYLFANLFALNIGGTTAMAIININTIITVLLGNIFLKEKVNSKILIALIVMFLSGTYAVYEKANIN